MEIPTARTIVVSWCRPRPGARLRICPETGLNGGCCLGATGAPKAPLKPTVSAAPYRDTHGTLLP